MSSGHLGKDVCGAVGQTRYKVSSYPSVQSHVFWPTPVSHPYCLIQLTSGCMAQMQESGWPSLLVSLSCNERVLLCLSYVVIGEVHLYCSGCNWQFWSHGHMANISLLLLPQSPLSGCYIALKNISNPQPLLALFYSRSRLLFNLFPTGYHWEFWPCILSQSI